MNGRPLLTITCLYIYNYDWWIIDSSRMQVPIHCEDLKRLPISIALTNSDTRSDCPITTIMTSWVLSSTKSASKLCAGLFSGEVRMGMKEICQEENHRGLVQTISSHHLRWFSFKIASSFSGGQPCGELSHSAGTVDGLNFKVLSTKWADSESISGV